MDISTLLMIGAASLLLAAVYIKAPDAAGRALKDSITLMIEIMPRIAAAFVIAGLIQAIVPQEIIARWMGKESGTKGIFIGMILGTLTPGGPMMQFPIVASLYKSGIGIGPLVSYLTAWSVLGFQRVIMWEIPFLGAPVVLVRLIASALFPLLAGWFSEFLWGKLKL
ncbi:MAG: permease [Deltaproteobacteria bacterium]|nr:permease [Deltaproteobacteria bacterium]